MKIPQPLTETARDFLLSRRDERGRYRYTAHNAIWIDSFVRQGLMRQVGAISVHDREVAGTAHYSIFELTSEGKRALDACFMLADG